MTSSHLLTSVKARPPDAGASLGTGARTSTSKLGDLPRHRCRVFTPASLHPPPQIALHAWASDSFTFLLSPFPPHVEDPGLSSLFSVPSPRAGGLACRLCSVSPEAPSGAPTLTPPAAPPPPGRGTGFASSFAGPSPGSQPQAPSGVISLPMGFVPFDFQLSVIPTIWLRPSVAPWH